MKKAHQSGFTLIEVTIVMGLIGVIAAFGVAMSFSSLSSTSVTQERDLFVTLLLRGTRAAAIANMEETAHGVQIDNDNHRYILFNGTSYDEDATSNRDVPYTNEAISVNNTGGDTVVFEQLSGDVIVGDGTITITNGSATQEITIRNSGQIDW
jgi:prepilin-type N-terminal cleavage/methylation domain-containing protein